MSQILSSQGKKRTFKPLSSLFSAFSNLKDPEFPQTKKTQKIPPAPKTPRKYPEKTPRKYPKISVFQNFGPRGIFSVFLDSRRLDCRTAEKMIRGRIFSEMIRVLAQKSEIEAESRIYRPKLRVTAGKSPRARTESPRKGPECGLGASTETPLKASNPPNKKRPLLPGGVTGQVETAKHPRPTFPPKLMALKKSEPKRENDKQQPPWRRKTTNSMLRGTKFQTY